ncbi:MAG TPA: class I SAM-dependent methyltransferase [Phycisphaerales bacterium]|nr:class I SAM-dependent methyltransferase [Phycisphaerales bacterium]HRQ76495.1 class I SAM-dependent methyltransferase [Phycisphaerales bacterium]
MSDRVDLYRNTYGNFGDQILTEIRQEVFGVDLGQNSWTTAEEYDRFCDWLAPLSGPDSHVLEVACGSGGPALRLSNRCGCRVTGIDVNEEAITTAKQTASARAGDVQFVLADMNKPLPFEEETFAGILCNDSMNHFADRLAVLREWHRVLKPKGRCVFTDPVVITGPVSNAELSARSNIGFFLFVPLDMTERFIREAGFIIIACEDATENIAMTSGRWHAARLQRRDNLLRIEGEERYEGLQQFFHAVHTLTSERRLSRFVYFIEKS